MFISSTSTYFNFNGQEAKQACESWRSQLGDALIKRYEPVFRSGTAGKFQSTGMVC